MLREVARLLRTSLRAHAWGALSTGLAVTASFGVPMGSGGASSVELLAQSDIPDVRSQGGWAQARGRAELQGTAAAPNVLSG